MIYVCKPNNFQTMNKIECLRFITKKEFHRWHQPLLTSDSIRIWTSHDTRLPGRVSLQYIIVQCAWNNSWITFQMVSEITCMLSILIRNDMKTGARVERFQNFKGFELFKVISLSNKTECICIINDREKRHFLI